MVSIACIGKFNFVILFKCVYPLFSLVIWVLFQDKINECMNNVMIVIQFFTESLISKCKG